VASTIQSISLGLPPAQDSADSRVKASPGFEALLASRTQAAASPGLVPPVRTRLDGTQAADALRAAWTKRYRRASESEGRCRF